MDLHYFGSFFEMFTAFNLGYAGSTAFRNGINDDVLTIDNAKSESIQTKINEVKNKITVTKEASKVGANHEKMLVKLDEISAEFLLKEKEINEKEEERRKFIKGFKSLFLVTGLFCLYVLLMEGYAQFYEVNYPNIISTSLFIFNFISIFILFIFYKSFGKKSDRPISPSVIVLVVFCFVMASIFLSPSCHFLKTPNAFRWVITWSVIIASMPVLLHLIRIVVHKKIYRFRYNTLIEYTTENISQIENYAEIFSKEFPFTYESIEHKKAQPLFKGSSKRLADWAKEKIIKIKIWCDKILAK